MSETHPDGEPRIYHLRLIVAGSTPRSRLAIENLLRVCNQCLHGQVDVEVIDMYQQPELAQKYQAIAAPTLVKLLPQPIRRVIGDLSNQDSVLRALDIVVLPVPVAGHD